MELKIVCAANKFFFEDGTNLIVPSARHWDVTMRYIMLCIPKKITDEIQGFIDQCGDFHTREEAWIIAEKNGQIMRRVGGDGVRLYSENLY